ncbi:Ig-like domain-containing protein [Flavobacterium pallidum]|uniref:PKD domain-containing protein n=1 Tax=Flavobacterium pallidum TaxID=2172098 RepID=A0A2S1SDU5_9FLAO|nr:T9SS type A sorting domain-containing protein [Flavobacterium pallidum]AWI24559.1 hypothetical protein HYN49_00875 [Flavobacterium pallidum]
MMKTINHYIIVFVALILSAASSYSQYHGGDAAGASTDRFGITSCPVPPHFYAYFGSTDDNVTVDILMNTSCSAPPPSFFAYMGGDNDSAGVEELSATACGTPPSFFAYMGGEQDSAHVDDLLAVSCGTPNQFYAYFGGADDGFALDVIGSCPVTPPVADFTASATATCVGGSINFTDTSTNIPFVWSWTFAGGTPATSTVQNPSVTYNAPGTYAVSLTATNYNGSNTKTIAGYITVTAIPAVASVTPGSRCDAGVVNLQATASAGVLRWYNVANGGSILGTGTFFPTGIINTTTTFYVEAASGSCVSARTAVVATVNTTPTVTATTPGSRCGTGSVTLGATASAGTLSWFDVANGGVALGTGTSFATPSISSDTTYYVQAANGSCISARTAVLANINSVPSVTSTTPGSRCDSGSVMLVATASAGTLNWYSVPNGGTVLGTGTSFVTPSISSNTNFYVEATNGTCTSARTVVLATASPSPAITSTTPSGRCDAGTVTLSATASAGTISWFDVANGGTAIGNGTNFITPSISATKTYYVETANGSCISTRVPVIASVTATPTVTATIPAGRCGTGSVTLGATASAGTLNWYGIAVGGTILGSGTAFATPNIAVTTTYYVEAVNGSCSSARTAVTATVSTMPTITTTTPASRCDTGTLTLSASASAGTLNWYDVPTGGSVLGSGNNFVTPSVSATTTYYVEAVSGNCTSPRTAVTATVNATPVISAATPGNRCGSGSVTIGAAATAGTINWYNVSTGGSVLGTGTSFVTPAISADTNFYAEAVNGSCTSARVAVLATINPVPTVTSTTPAGRCDSGSVTLGATASSGTLNWYSVPNGGTVLGTGTSFITPAISSNTNFYVEATNGTCTSARTIVLATASATPVITNTTPSGRCDAGTVTLTATASAGIISWFDVANGGIAIGSGSTFITPSIGTTTTYYVETANGSCVSARIAVIASVNTTPSVTATVPGERCGNGIVNLSATASAGTLRWYNVPTGGTILGTGTSFNTPFLSATTTYYVEAVNGSCISPRVSIMATLNTMPVVVGTTSAGRCSVGEVVIEAESNIGTLNWYSAQTGGVLLGTGPEFTTPSISETTFYYVEAVNGGCTSSRVAVEADVYLLEGPTGSASQSFCSGATIGQLVANGTNITWYNAPTGGILLSNSTPLVDGTVYYASQHDGNCDSFERLAVTATITAAPIVTATVPGQRCGNGIVSLGATASSGTLNWYSVQNGGTVLGTGTSFNTPVLSATATYYVEAVNGTCISARIAVLATVDALPQITSTTPASRCDSGSVTLQATADSGTLNWYAAPSGGTAIGTGNSFATPSMNTSTTYYVEVTNGNCTSVRTAVLASVNVTPTVTSVTPGERCDAGSVTLSATASAGNLRWYAAPTGGSLLGTGTTFATPVIAVTTTYYVEARAIGCNSPRTAVIATISNPEIISTVPASRCGSGDVMLEAISSAGTVNWYDQPTGGTLLSTGSLYQTNALSGTTTFYAEAVNGTCVSTRTAVTATVNIVATPTGNANQTFCNGETVGQLLVSGNDISWYDAPSNGNLIADGAPLVNGATYYASQNDGSCDSDVRLAVTVTTGACLNVDNLQSDVLNVYPNPVTDFLNVSYSQNIANVQIINMIGQIVLDKKIGTAETRLDMSHLAAGTYLVKVSADNLFKTIKIIKR